MTHQHRFDVGDEYGDGEARGKTSGQDPVIFDCDHCEAVLRTRTIAAMKDRGTTHLEAHRAALFEVFTDKRRGRQCQNECGYLFSADGDRGPSHGSPGTADGDPRTADRNRETSHGTRFECPQCGHDNFEAFAHRYLYWRIDYPEDFLGESGRG